MEIISHRGYWKEPNEKNTTLAFKRSFKLGLGTETDVRDANGRLVISHDIPVDDAMLLDDFLELYLSENCTGTLALNIKADGMHTRLKESLHAKNITNYFLFDGSIPDTVVSLRHGLKTLVRHSEFEPETILWSEAAGVWFDRFSEFQLPTELVLDIIEKGKIAAIVSEELHNRNPHKLWSEIKALPKKCFNSPNLVLCTDLPEDARVFFYGK